MLDIIISLTIGMLPDVIFFTYFLTYIKDIKTKRVRLFILTMITYIVCIMISQYNTYLYLLFIFIYYGILMLLYKEKIQLTEIFLILIMSAYLSYTSYFCFKFVKSDFSNYYFLAIISKIVLFIPILIRKKIRKIYKKYCIWWNRNDGEKRPIKSITIRNISLIIFNIFIVSINILILYIKSIL